MILLDPVAVIIDLGVSAEEFNMFIEAQFNRLTYEDIYNIILG